MPEPAAVFTAQQCDAYVRDLFDLTGRVAVVTGAGAGIGRALALGLAGAGAAVVCADCNAETAAATARALTDAGYQSLPVAVDVAVDADVARLVAIAGRELGGLDILVNNAGIAHIPAPIHELRPAEWQRVLDVNLTSIYLCVRHAVPQMLVRGGGKIINTASMWGFFGSREAPLPAYAATKGAVVNLTRQLALDYASARINVNAIAPGFIRTGFTKPERVPTRILETPLGRYGEPPDLIGAAVFLAARASDFMTGQTLVIDGGYTLY